MDETREFYNRLARSYDQVTVSRISYLDAIDTLIAEHVASADRYLDIGAGDGRRSLKIAREVGATQIALLDISPEISRNIKPTDRIELFVGYLEDYKPSVMFDLITSLWNVIGHIDGQGERLRFLKKCENLLSENGSLVIDVNNRYNISYYGKESVMNNLEKDVKSDASSGYFNLTLGEIKAKVYIHAPFEIESLLEKTGLEVKQQLYIDYNSGELKSSCFEGQLLYFIGHRK